MQGQSRSHDPPSDRAPVSVVTEIVNTRQLDVFVSLCSARVSFMMSSSSSAPGTILEDDQQLYDWGIENRLDQYYQVLHTTAGRTRNK